MAAEAVPHQVTRQGASHCRGDRQRQAELAGARQGPRCQQQRRGRDRHTGLVEKDRAKDEQVAVVAEDLRQLCQRCVSSAKRDRPDVIDPT